MNEKLYSNIKKMTTIFTIAILCITVGILLLRLTIFSKKASGTPKIGKFSSSNTASEYDVSFGDKIIFDTAKANGSLKLKYPKESDFSIRFNIIMKDNERVIYSSKTIDPGDKSINVKLSKNDLAKGDYSCIVEVTAFDLQTDERLETFNKDLTVVIKNDSPT